MVDRANGWFRGDCHVHTLRSVGADLTAAQLVIQARAAGLQAGFTGGIAPVPRGARPWSVRMSSIHLHPVADANTAATSTSRIIGKAPEAAGSR